MSYTYTPGPWRFERPTVASPYAYVLSEHDSRNVAELNDNRNEYEANGLLIAAAPTMYEALVTRIARHDAQVRAHGGTECEDDFCNTFRPIVEAVHASR